MSVTVPTSWPGTNLADHAEGQEIAVADWTEIIQNQNYLYARRGTRVAGRVWSPVFETTATSATKTNSSATAGAFGAEGFFAHVPLLRLARTGTTAIYKVTFAATLYNAKADFAVTQADGTSITSVTLSNGSAAWSEVTSTINITAASYDEIVIELEGFYTTTGTGYAAAVGIKEAILTASQTPNGR